MRVCVCECLFGCQILISLLTVGDVVRSFQLFFIMIRVVPDMGQLTDELQAQPSNGLVVTTSPKRHSG